MRRILPLIALVLMSAGCSLHQPRPALPPEGMPDHFQSMPEAKPSSNDTANWWSAFADDRLDALILQAFSDNPGLARAMARLDRARAQAGISAAAGSPVLNLEGSAGRERRQMLNITQTEDVYRLAAAASYELDLWGRLRQRESAARLEVLAAQEDVRAMRVSLAATLADLYFLAMEARAQLELTRQAELHARQNLELAQRRYRHGQAPILDVHQARQNLARVTTAGPGHEARLAQAEHALAILLGQYPGSAEFKQLAGDRCCLPPAPDIFNPGLPSGLLADRPDIQAALFRLSAADARIGAAVAERFPAFRLTAAVGGASTELASLLSSGNIFWNLLMGVVQPLLDGGLRQAEVRRSEAEFQELLAGYHETVLKAFAEVEDALALNETTTRRIALLEDQHGAAARTLESAQWRYRQGLNDFLPVLLAQTALVEVDGALLAANRQLLTDRIQLARALGGTLRTPDPDPLIPFQFQ